MLAGFNPLSETMAGRQRSKNDFGMLDQPPACFGVCLVGCTSTTGCTGSFPPKLFIHAEDDEPEDHCCRSEQGEPQPRYSGAVFKPFGAAMRLP